MGIDGKTKHKRDLKYCDKHFELMYGRHKNNWLNIDRNIPRKK